MLPNAKHKTKAYRIRPKTNRWGMEYGKKSGGGHWHWYDFLIGFALFGIWYIINKTDFVSQFLSWLLSPENNLRYIFLR